MANPRLRTGLYVGLALVTGFAAGCVVFRLPAFACGPFRSDLTAQWVAAAGGILAAGATLWAVLVAINTSKQATRTVLDLRARDEAAEAAKLSSMRLRLSVIFRNEMYILAGQYVQFQQQIQVAAASGKWSRLKEILERHFPEQGLFLMEKFASDFYAFEAGVGGDLAVALWRWKTYCQRPSATGIHPSALMGAADATIGSLNCAIRDLRIAHAALFPYLPPNAIVSHDERAFSNTAMPYPAAPEIPDAIRTAG